MNVVEKRDFIHSHLHLADEVLINEFYEMLRKEEVLKAKLEDRAKRSEDDIRSGKLLSRAEVEEQTRNIGR